MSRMLLASPLVFLPPCVRRCGVRPVKQVEVMPQMKDWAVGDHCRAVFQEDGVEYEGTIGFINTNGEGNSYANILYIGYNNEETQWLTDLKPSKGKVARLAQVREATGGCEPEAEKNDWAVGKYCRATFAEDGTEYEGQLTTIEVDSDGNKYGVVVYLGLKNEETQWLDDLKPSRGDAARSKQIKDAKGDSAKAANANNLVNELSNHQVVSKWLAPRMLKISDGVFIKMRITAVDGAFQIYGHLRSSGREMRKMKALFHDRYQVQDHPEDSKEEWRVGEACVAVLHDVLNGNLGWYRAQVVELYEWTSEVGIIYVDLGIVRTVKYSDLRVARAFGETVCDAELNFHQ